MPVSLLQPCTDILSKSKIGGTTYGITAAEGMDKSSAKHGREGDGEVWMTLDNRLQDFYSFESPP